MNRDRERTVLAELSRELGDPAADYAILAEGNTSLRVDDDLFLLKASGFSLAEATAESFVEMRLGAVLELLERPVGDDEGLAAALGRCRTAAEGPRPSVEAALHALGLTVGEATVIGHTHPTPVNALLCSVQAEAVIGGALFPDQIVVCGRHPLLVPYVDPGVPLGLELRDRLLVHVERYGAPPKTIYLRNHGLIALGQSPAEVLQITQMATKAARILLGCFAAGGPRPLSAAAADRIATRPDEQHRQRMLRLRDA